MRYDAGLNRHFKKRHGHRYPHLETPDPSASDATISLWSGMQAGSLARACDAIQDGSDMGAHNLFGVNPMTLAIYAAANSLDLIDLLLESGDSWVDTDGGHRALDHAKKLLDGGVLHASLAQWHAKELAGKEATALASAPEDPKCPQKKTALNPRRK